MYEDITGIASDEYIICYDKNGYKLSHDEIAELFAKYDNTKHIESY
jgi:hypothetical protein